MKHFTKMMLLCLAVCSQLIINAQSTQTGPGGAGHSPGGGGTVVRYCGWDASLAANAIPFNLEHRGTNNINFLTGNVQRMTILGTASANPGFVGIGTATPAFHLSLDNDGGILAQGILATGATIPPGLTAPRMFWYPYRAAFRAGQAQLGEWDDLNIGDFSVAFGERTTASGHGACAFGDHTKASGIGAFAIGPQAAEASGWGSFAGGFDVFATNRASFVFGENAMSTGPFSTCFGTAAQATGQLSFAFGSFITASATNSYVLGDGLFATPLINAIPNSLMVGFQSDVPTFYVGSASGVVGSLGNVGIGTSTPADRCEINSAIANTSGLTFTQLTSTSPTVPGGNPGPGVLAVALDGKVIYVPANNGQVGGICGAASGSTMTTDRELPLGGNNLIFSGNSLTKDRVGIGMVGSCTPIAKLQVENNASTGGAGIGGLFINSGTNTSSTINAAVFGRNSVVGSPLSNVGGFFTVANSTNANIGVQCSASGTGVAAENYGGRFLSTNSAANNFGVFADASGATGNNYAIFAEALPATGSGGPNYAGYFNGDLIVTGYFGPPSDVNLKQNIDSLSNALSFINQLKPKTFEFNTAAYPQMGLSTVKQYGLIAQDVELILPELIGSATQPAVRDSLGNVLTPALTYKTLNYQAFTAILIKGMQEQEKKVDSLTQALSDVATIVNSCCSLSAIQQSNSSNKINSNQNVTLRDGQNIVLEQNVPNPFAEQTSIGYFLPDNVIKAQLLFYNAQGRLIQSMDLTEKGNGSVNVFAQDLSNGIYTYTLVADGKIIETKKMVKQK